MGKSSGGNMGGVHGSFQKKGVPGAGECEGEGNWWGRVSEVHCGLRQENSRQGNSLEERMRRSEVGEWGFWRRSVTELFEAQRICCNWRSGVRNWHFGGTVKKGGLGWE
jgi:hypothetical protein